MTRNIVLVMGLVAGSTAVSRAPGNPTQPTPRPGVFSQHESDLTLARASQPSVIFLGDSITNRWRSTGRAAWERSITPLRAAYLAVGEARVEHLLWRLRSGEFQGLSPRTVVILIGTNNVARDYPDDIARGILLVVAECRSLWPEARIVLMGILPRGDRGSWRFNRSIECIDRSLAGLRDDHVSYLDIGPALADERGYLAPQYAVDGVHLSAAGYEVWARALADGIGIRGQETGVRSSIH